MKVKRTSSYLLSACIFAYSCGGGVGSNPAVEGISGTIVAPDGKTPLPGATVYIPQQGSKAPAYVSGVQSLSNNCPPPSTPYIVYTCTQANGSFTLPGNYSGQVTIKFFKGAFKGQFTFNPSNNGGNTGAIVLAKDPSEGAPKIAVITGSYDSMEDILAKLGFGDVESGRLKLGTEKFDLYDGNYSLDDSTYPNFPKIFDDNDGDGKPDIYKYDIVFINCGNSYESLLADSTKRNIIRDYVNSGGRLYVTDLSYDFVEQVFPEYIDFLGSDSTPETDREDLGAAEKGVAGEARNSDVLDQLRDWLKVVTCVDSYGSPISCVDSSTGKVDITSLSGGWAVMNDAHTGKASEVKIWVKGNVTWYNPSYSQVSGEKPLTITFKHGSGKVLYTSYHTKASYSSGLSPQERILQYLVFF